jgi:hypothetical protein
VILKEGSVGNENYLVLIHKNDVLLTMIILMNNGEMLNRSRKSAMDLTERVLDRIVMVLLV